MMVRLREFLWSVGSLFTNLFQHPDWHNIVDVLILAVLIYNGIKLVMHTRSNSLFKGIAAVLVIAWLASALHLSAVSWLLTQIISMGLLFIVILFQPEFRRGLEQIGRSRLMRRVIGLPARQDPADRVESSVAEIVRAMSNMSRKKIGALIIIERHTGLGDVVETGTRVDAEISAPLIENIFEPNTPLHDGAMVILNRRIEAAACILPLSEDPTISRELGTRHRAAIGITETTDAVSLIVSEETGIISMAREGRLTRHLDGRSLTILLTELFTPDRSMYSWIGTLRREAPEDGE
ncbi:MAG: diadenylate cyclase CdaA [Clostridia bacterium]|nr:diadenylate cyclase CdaA [Clostridia bacterium]